MIELDRHIAVVTGAASGIGRAIAQRLARQNAKVAIADLDGDGGAETAALIKKDHGVAEPFVVDVTDNDAVLAFRDQVREAFGTTSVLVNCAGWDLGMPFLQTTPDFWQKVIAINYVGPVATSHAFLSDMVENGISGHVVNIASDAGRVGSMGETVYAGAKGGLIAFTKSLAREMARSQINVNCVCPGPTDTKLFYEQPEKVRNAVVRAIPFKRLGQPTELADAVAFLASDEASFITGQVLSVSGGLTMNG
jgi:2-hydroxycyclohexanecarboxyl-CoA dehydrogenase